MEYNYEYIPAHASNYGSRRVVGDIKYICVHYTGNVKDTAQANAHYFQSADRKASAHYFVSGQTVAQSVPDAIVAWSVGGGKWSDCSSTGGGKLFGTVKNANSISVEICADCNYEPSRETLRTAIRLIRSLMDKYDIDSAHVVRHFDVNGKHCPAWLMSPMAWRLFILALEARE